jgi:Tfp pilus assembly PilM family ATPase
MTDVRLPLGIDLGAARTRVVALHRRADGSLRLAGVESADVDGDPAASLATALRRLGIRERRCAAMIRAPDGRLQGVRLPPMPRREAERAARFEAVAGLGATEPIVVRSVTLDCDARGARHVLVAAAPLKKVKAALSVLSAVGLRAVRLDHEACALARAGQLPLLDIGLSQSTLIARAGLFPVARTIPYGGEHFTHALADEYGTSNETAELRKRTIGLGGAAKQALEVFARSLAAELDAVRGGDGSAISELRVCGNGARLIALRETLERDLGLRVAPVDLAPRVITDLPIEAERSGALDWFGAIAVTLPVAA